MHSIANNAIFSIVGKLRAPTYARNLAQIIYQYAIKDLTDKERWLVDSSRNRWRNHSSGDTSNSPTALENKEANVKAIDKIASTKESNNTDTNNPKGSISKDPSSSVSSIDSTSDFILWQNSVPYFPILCQSVFLACKIADYSVSSSHFENISGYRLDGMAESKICEAIGFNFDIPDIRVMFSNLCRMISADMSSYEAKLDLIFCDERVNKVAFIKNTTNNTRDLIDVPELCIATLNDQNLDLLEIITCSTFDRDRIDVIRSEIFY